MIERLLLERFLARTDRWVEEDARGYRARRGRLGERELAAHLSGATSVCAYCLAPGPDGAVCRWGALDLDAEGAEPGPLPPVLQRRLAGWAGVLAGELAAIVGPRAVLVEATGGRGLHVWALLIGPTPAAWAQDLMDAAVRAAGARPGARVALEPGLALERFPKGDALRGRGVGTALRLPLGIHPRSGRRSFLFDPTTGEARAPRAALLAGAVAGAARGRTGERPVAPDAWLAYRWAVAELGLSDRTAEPPAGEGSHPVRCLFPERHAHGDRPPGSAYLIRDGATQLFGCSVCRERALDTIALVRELRPGIAFPAVLAVCHGIDPARCPPPRGRPAAVRGSGRR